jgi:hypothetical protein
MTIEAWIRPTDVSQQRPVAEWINESGGLGVHLWIAGGSVGPWGAARGAGIGIVHDGATVTFTALARDPDIPANRLTYSLGGGAPAGATIDPMNGLFHWIARATQVPATNQVMLIARDDGIPGFDGAQIFNIVVMGPRIEAVSLSGTNLLISWTAIAGTLYAVEFNSTPEEGGWVDLPGEVEASQATATKSTPVDAMAARFYPCSPAPVGRVSRGAKKELNGRSGCG